MKKRPWARDQNRSPWLDETGPYEPMAALRGSQRADVAIVGGGLGGVSTAWHLSRRFPDLRIVLLEAETIAHGASGRNGGQVVPGMNGFKPASPEAMRRVYDVTCLGIDAIEEAISLHSIDAGFSRRGCLEVQTTQRSAEAAQSRVEAARSAGIPLVWRPGTTAPLHGATGVIHDPAGARVNGAALARGLRPTLLERGVGVFENTPVVAIDEGEPIRLETPEGEVRAAALVLTTGAYSPALGYFGNEIVPIHSHVVATAPLSESQWQAIGWGDYEGFTDDRDRIAYGCRTPEGRLLLGGGDNGAYSYLYGGSPVFLDAAGARTFDSLRHRLAAYFPALEDVAIEHQWSGTLDLTLDRTCTMGVRGERRNVYYALGYGGRGLALAMLAGRVLTDLYAGDHEPWRDVPFYERRLRRVPPEPLRWIGYHLYTRLGRLPRLQA